jgi:L-alanine-DL-glutamate epimerase-like enolase superfamily enzyme
MHINARLIDLKLTTPFRISRGVQETSPNVMVEILHNDMKGYGEASPAEYYGESPTSVLACIDLKATWATIRSRWKTFYSVSTIPLDSILLLRLLWIWRCISRWKDAGRAPL